MKIIENLIKDFAPKINSSELEHIISKFTIHKIPKNNYFLKKRQVCHYLSFVQAGCFKVYHGENDKEVNVWFAFENMPITEMQSFINQQPSAYAIKALEDAEIISISYDDLNTLYETIPDFQLFGLRLTEKILSKTIKRLTSFQFETAEKRYEQLLKETNYINRISVNDLSSYLGITANSLSRIRASQKK
ncbi:MAG TPA: Crp/Fnr family transcriptional regulator [Flavobacterium sp.]|nr:Crp/Fnr family transcriptional regulator [Flavobacterium sp.]